MKLYQLPYSHFSAKVRIVLLEKQIPAELPDIPGDAEDKSEYLRINPTGLVPCLVDEEFVLSESEVIAEYLEELQPEPVMLPADARQKAHSRWLSRVHDLYLAPVLSGMFGLTLSDSPDVEARTQLLSERDKYLSMLETSVSPSPYFFGNQFCISDASLCLSFWFAIGLSAQLDDPISQNDYPKLFKWFDAVSQRESVNTVISDCKLALGLSDDEVKTA